MRSHRQHKRDANHAVIQAALEHHGIQCKDMYAVGGGFPDLVTYDPVQDVYRLVEIKSDSNWRGKRDDDGKVKGLSEDQKAFVAKFPDWPICYVTSVEEALTAHGINPDTGDREVVRSGKTESTSQLTLLSKAR